MRCHVGIWMSNSVRQLLDGQMSLAGCSANSITMVHELKDKEKLRQTFGFHVGRRAAERILARDPGLSGVEEEITVMFVDMRSWTARASASPPAEIVEIMNDFFRVSVCAVEEEHRGMINKYWETVSWQSSAQATPFRIMPAMLCRQGAKFCARSQV